jgi:predicted kinase
MARLAQVTGTERTRLVILRGNSGSGKSTTAKELRRRLGRGVAWVEQDYLRRIVLREHDVAGGVNIGLIDAAVRYVLDNGYDAILEGIFYTRHYEQMLHRLTSDHLGITAHYYFDIPFEETVARHATRPLSREVTVRQLRGWYAERDLLSFVDEQIVDRSSALDDTVTRIMADMTWRSGPAVAHPIDEVAIS